MSLFGKLFGDKAEGKKEVKSKVPWIVLSTQQQLDAIIANSSSKTQLIFKHSTTCGISRMVLNMFEKGFTIDEQQVDAYFLDIHSNRGLSNAIENQFAVIHESPQLLVIKKGQVTFHTSHGGISDTDLNTVV